MAELKLSRKYDVSSSIPINWFISCDNSLFAGTTLTRHKIQDHCSGVTQCWACSSLKSAPLPACIGVAKGSPRDHVPPIFRTYSRLCCERRYHKQKSVIRLKSNILAPTKLLAPQIFGWIRYCLRGQAANLASGLFYCWSSLCNSNMATNLQMFTSSYDIRRFVACDSWMQTSWQVK